MRRMLSIVAAAILAVVCLTSVSQAQASPTAAVSLGNGLDKLELTAGGYHVHGIHITAAAPVDLKVVPAAPVAGRRKTTDLCREQGCKVAINGGFFNDGHYPDQPDGMPVGDVLAPGFALVHGINAATQQLSISPDGRFSADTACSPTASSCLGASYYLLKHGAAQPLPPEDSRTWGPNPLTLVCWNDAGDRWFFVSEGRESRGRQGLTLPQLAGICQSMGGTDAIGMDGGGSSTETIDGSLINVPSDVRAGVHVERPVSNTIMVFCRIPCPPPPPPPPKPVVAARPAPPPPPTTPPTTVPVTVPPTTVPVTTPVTEVAAAPIAVVRQHPDGVRTESAAVAICFLVFSALGVFRSRERLNFQHLRWIVLGFEPSSPG